MPGGPISAAAPAGDGARGRRQAHGAYPRGAAPPGSPSGSKIAYPSGSLRTAAGEGTKTAPSGKGRSSGHLASRGAPPRAVSSRQSAEAQPGRAVSRGARAGAASAAAGGTTSMLLRPSSVPAAPRPRLDATATAVLVLHSTAARARTRGETAALSAPREAPPLTPRVSDPVAASRRRFTPPARRACAAPRQCAACSSDRPRRGSAAEAAPRQLLTSATPWRGAPQSPTLSRAREPRLGVAPGARLACPRVAPRVSSLPGRSLPPKVLCASP